MPASPERVTPGVTLVIRARSKGGTGCPPNGGHGCRGPFLTVAGVHAARSRRYMGRAKRPAKRRRRGKAATGGGDRDARPCRACGYDVPELAAACPRCWTPITAGLVSEPTSTPQGELRRAADLWLPGVGGIVRLALAIYVRHLRVFVSVAAPVVVPLQALNAIVRGVLPQSGDVVVGSPFGHPLAPPPGIDGVALLILIVGRVAMVGLASLTIHMAAALCFRAVGDACAGRHPDRRSTWAFALDHRMDLLRVAGIHTALVCSGLLLGIVPGVWFFVSWSVVMPAALVEGNGGGSALRRSAQLVRGRWWPVFRVVGAVTLTLWVAGLTTRSVLGGLASMVGDGAFLAVALDALASVAAGMLLTPLAAIAIGPLYLDLNVRKEGLSVEELGRRLGSDGGRRKRG